MLGIRRGFVGKSYSDRGSHPNRFRHLSPERRAYSNNPAHNKYRRQPIGRFSSMADDVDLPISV